MVRSLYTAATGMRAQQQNVDNISNNLANVNTVGYKQQKTEFKSLLYQTIQTRTTTANGEQKPIGAQVGLGTRVASNTAIYTQGTPTATESGSDFAISGEGFFQVKGIGNEVYYTRAGNFTWAEGNNGVTLCTSDGYEVLDSTGKEKEDTMFFVALFSRCYWMLGAVVGGVLGQVIPFDMEGIDFCMTALFLIIFIDQWEKNKNHVPAVLGLAVAFICLLLIGPQNFMLLALLMVSGMLLLQRQNEEKNNG